MADNWPAIVYRSGAGTPSKRTVVAPSEAATNPADVICVLLNADPARKFPATTTISDRKSTRLNSSHLGISYAVFCLKKNSGADLTAMVTGSKRGPPAHRGTGPFS